MSCGRHTKAIRALGLTNPLNTNEMWSELLSTGHNNDGAIMKILNNILRMYAYT